MTEDEVAALYRNYGYTVFRRCVVYLGDPNVAQDAAQQVFVRALRAAADVRRGSDPRTWLCRIVDHYCVEVLRGRAPNIDSEPIRGEAHAKAIAAAIGDDDLESLSMVRRLLEGLDPDSVQLAVLYYVDELAEEQLARELGGSRRTIAKRLQQLLASARGHMREENAS